jgi:thioredoxin 1
MNIIATDEQFEKEVIGTDKFVLVDFFATWCGPCQVLGPILENLSKQFEGRIIFAKADVDNIPLTSQKFGVEKIPTVTLFKAGKPINTFVGLVPENKIKEWLENLLK